MLWTRGEKGRGKKGRWWWEGYKSDSAPPSRAQKLWESPDIVHVTSLSAATCSPVDYKADIIGEKVTPSKKKKKKVTLCDLQLCFHFRVASEMCGSVLFP